MSTAKQFNNLIFDMGNVLLKYDSLAFIKKEGITDDVEIEILLNNIYKSPNWVKQDTGEWMEEDLEREAIKNIPEHLHEVAHKLIYKWYDNITPIDGMANLIKKCKDAGYNIYLLSNAAKNQVKYWENVPGHEYFDGVVVSAFINLIKPDEKIYRHILEKFNLVGEECLFIDDLQANLDGAENFGISTFLFNDNAKELEEFIFNGNN